MFGHMRGRVLAFAVLAAGLGALPWIGCISDRKEPTAAGEDGGLCIPGLAPCAYPGLVCNAENKCVPGIVADGGTEAGADSGDAGTSCKAPANFDAGTDGAPQTANEAGVQCGSGFCNTATSMCCGAQCVTKAPSCTTQPRHVCETAAHCNPSTTPPGDGGVEQVCCYNGGLTRSCTALAGGFASTECKLRGTCVTKDLCRVGDPLACKRDGGAQLECVPTVVGDRELGFCE